MATTLDTASEFELMQLPDGRWCVGEFATPTSGAAGQSPAGFYATRDEAELAILRAHTSARDPQTQFSEWLRAADAA